jgi:hypothetical protein
VTVVGAVRKQLSTAGRPTALFLHKPLFLERTDDVASPACMVPSARTRLLDKLNRSHVRLIVSGHLHQHRDCIRRTTAFMVPAVAFAVPQAHGGDGRCGVTVLDFSQNSVEVTIERPYKLISHDLAAIKVTAAISSCAICRLVLRPTLADVG